MKNSLLIYVLICFTLVVVACNGPKDLSKANDLLYLKQGMEYSILDSIFNLKSKIRFNIEFENEGYTVVASGICNFHHSQSSSYKVPGPSIPGPSSVTPNNPYGGFTKTETTKSFDMSKSEYDKFYLIFKNRTLVNWGYLYEFKNSDSEKANKWGELLFREDKAF
ncbi:MAG: hypothetical protein NTW25_07690 [Candidatus Kapabacteria bacterium]|nr:hypothetical protein [Candidatus Kapabacteria bacterium]